MTVPAISFFVVGFLPLFPADKAMREWFVLRPFQPELIDGILSGSSQEDERLVEPPSIEQHSIGITHLANCRA
jgi:hypothetical protein